MTGVVEENKEKKFICGFIGDNTHSVLPQIKLGKFLKDYEIHSVTKKKGLLDSIRIAKELLKNKGVIQDTNFEKMKKTNKLKVNARIVKEKEDCK